MSKKENELEKMMRAFGEDVYSRMGWGALPIIRFKAGNTEQWKGYCYGRYANGVPHDVYVIVSTNDKINRRDKDFWDSLLHELIHVRLWQIGKPIHMAFGHGKAFKNIAKEFATITNNEFSYKRIMK